MKANDSHSEPSCRKRNVVTKVTLKSKSGDIVKVKQWRKCKKGEIAVKSREKSAKYQVKNPKVEAVIVGKSFEAGGNRLSN